jgi:hypothetical protein
VTSKLGDGARRGANSLRLRGGALADIGEQFAFQRQDLLFGVEHLALVIFQLGRGEALGVGQRLLALVIGGREMQVGARDFEVIAEDIVEAHLQRLDAGTLPFARFDLRDVLAAVQAEIAQFVEFGVETGADGAPVSDGQGRLVGNRFQDGVGDVGQFIETLVQGPQARGLLGIEATLQRGNLLDRAAQCQQIARAGRPECHLGQQALQIENAAQFLTYFGPQDGLLEQIFHRIEPLFDLRAIERRTEQALPQKAAAHAGEGLIERRQHRRLLLRA